MPLVAAAPRADLAVQVSLSCARAVPVMERTGRLLTEGERALAAQ